MAELRSSAALDSSQALAAAHAALQRDLDAEHVRLTVRQVDRARQEALRLREALALQEAAAGDRYQAVLQRQRLDFEALLARRLREQEDALARRATAALQAKDEAVAGLLRAAAATHDAEARATRADEARRIGAELAREHEARRARELGAQKEAHAAALAGHAATLATLRDRLATLEARLAAGDAYESGSRAAHRA